MLSSFEVHCIPDFLLLSIKPGLVHVYIFELLPYNHSLIDAPVKSGGLSSFFKFRELHGCHPSVIADISNPETYIPDSRERARLSFLCCVFGCLKALSLSRRTWHKLFWFCAHSFGSETYQCLKCTLNPPPWDLYSIFCRCSRKGSTLCHHCNIN